MDTGRPVDAFTAGRIDEAVHALVVAAQRLVTLVEWNPDDALDTHKDAAAQARKLVARVAL